jgi:hypothetical protein
MTRQIKSTAIAAMVLAAIFTSGCHQAKTNSPPARQDSAATSPVSPDDAKISAMTADQFARSFFEACGREDWEQVARFWPPGAPLDDRFKKALAGLKVISIGKPFKKDSYGGVFVPYEIQFKNGEVKKFNLAVRQDNPDHRWYFDGGL